MPITRVPGDLATMRDDISDIEVDLATIEGYAEKIDDAASDGLDGALDSAAYRAGESERHVHSYACTFEAAAVPNAEIHVADRIGDGLGAFQADADNDDWGAWVQLLGSADTSDIYDFHRISIEAVEREATYYVQFGFGASGAAALAAGAYSDFVYIPLTNKKEPGPVLTQSRRQAAGTKAWARTKCPGQDTATIDLYPELHFYEG